MICKFTLVVKFHLFMSYHIIHTISFNQQENKIFAKQNSPYIFFLILFKNPPKCPIRPSLLWFGNTAVAQWVRTLAPQAEGWVFESQPRKTYVIITGSDSSTAKRSALVCVTRVLGDAHYKRISCGTLKNPHCSRAMRAKHRSEISSLSPLMGTYP